MTPSSGPTQPEGEQAGEVDETEQVYYNNGITGQSVYNSMETQ